MKLDQTGTKRDSKFQLQNACTYLFNRVQIAQNAIYKSTAVIAGPNAGKSSSQIFIYLIYMFHSQNAFINKLGCDFNLPHMLIVDLLQKFELGVWKALFTHLIRILYAAAPHGSLVAELDRQYVDFSTVGYWGLISSVTTRFWAMPMFGSSYKGPKGQANSLSMCNPRTDGNDQGGDPISSPCLYILHR